MATKVATRQKKKFRNLTRYAGRWVAFIGTDIVASADTLKELMREVDSKGLRNKVSVFLVPRRDEGPYWAGIISLYPLLSAF